MPISPTAEGFRAALRRPLLTFAEISWRWVVGATATLLFFFGLLEFLNTLPVTSGELLFLRSRQPFLVAQALAHILRGSVARGLISLIIAAVLMALLWIIAASAGRIATVGAMVEYFRERFAGPNAAIGSRAESESEITSNVSPGRQFLTLYRLNFLRVALAVAAIVGVIGAGVVAGFASTPQHPRPAMASLVFIPLVGVICIIGYALNWLLSLAAVFAVRDGEDVIGAIAAAAALCRERTAAVMAVGTWTGLAHLVVFVGASTIVGFPLGLAGLLPWRLVALGLIVVTLAYFAVADWLYTARLAGYVCIAEMPESLLAPPPIEAPSPQPPPLESTIDRDEPILSDIPNLAVET